jgi:hypothetical protein
MTRGSAKECRVTSHKFPHREGATVHLDATLHYRTHLSADSFCPFRKLIVLISAFVDADLHAIVDAVDRLPGQHKPLIIPPFDDGLQNAQDGPLVLVLAGNATISCSATSAQKKSFVKVCTNHAMSVHIDVMEGKYRF